MAKSLILSNGSLLVGLDHLGQVYDFYYPSVGQENHTGGRYVHKIGVWIDGAFTWIDDGSWNVIVRYDPDTMCSNIVAQNDQHKIEIRFRDTVYNELPLFIRKVEVVNRSTQEKEVRLFFNQQMIISEATRGNTAFYHPLEKVVIHYKGRRVFLVNTMNGVTVGFDDYSVGLLAIEGKEGTYKDAEDGVLSKNNIEHGLVDSVVALHWKILPNDKVTGAYWIVVGKSIEEAMELNKYVIQKTPDYLINTTGWYWHSWANQRLFTFEGLSPEEVTTFKQSLQIIRAHINSDNGTIIASSDSDLLKNGRDMYTYVWPRDAAFVTVALDAAGYTYITKSFFEFANNVITPEGYFMHKYLADMSLGSSWHPWILNGEPILPIQIDETALVLFALWHHYTKYRDLEFIEKVYNSLIKKAANFLAEHLVPGLGLPKPCYDLWEEKFGIHTFTAASVYAAFNAAAKFANLLGKLQAESEYLGYAELVKNGILHHLYNQEQGYFNKMISYNQDKEKVIDETVDVSSVYGVWKFGVLPINAPQVQSAIKVTKERLKCNTEIGGYCRYENDGYFRVSPSVPGNPWIISSMWMAQYDINAAKNKEELMQAAEQIKWACQHSYGAGMLPEQLHPYSGSPISATPLIWSHAEYVNTVMEYMQKIAKFGIAPLETEFTY